MSSPGAPSSAPSRRQKRMGPAPFASFEDLSDEVRSRLDSPEDKHAAGSVVRLPGIREDATPSTPAHVEQTQEFIYTGISLVGAPVTPPLSATAGAPATPPSTTISSLSTPQESQTSTKMSLQTPSTPRIDISRASSSSHHEDSRDSTPERELFEGHDQGGAKLGLAFKEEGTLDLRSSTEELDFQDPQEKLKAHKIRPQSPCLHEDSLYQRKDSQSSEIGLLSISGRTSRLSSIGSQGSTHSRISNVSHLSIISGQSGRSPSPHKMLLETSFCGNKPPVSAQHSVGQPGTKVDSDVLEKVLLSRKHDPREAILAEGISMEVSKTKEQNMRANVPNERPVKKSEKPLTVAKSDITITVDKPSVSESNNSDRTLIPGKYLSPSGVEYTYIPLKGPLPKDLVKETVLKPKLREAKSAAYSKSTAQSKNKEVVSKSRSKSASSSPSVQKYKSSPLSPSGNKEEPKYIRIKLKPDHMYDEEPSITTNQEVKKPVCLDLNETSKKPFQSFTQVVGEAPVETVNFSTRNTENQSRNLSDTPTASPKPTRHNVLKETTVSSKTPSPSLSRRSSFTSLFKSRETIVSPESPTVPGLKRKNTLTGILKDASENIRERTRSRSKSRERERSSLSTAPSSTESIDSKSKQQKSVLSIFKPKKPSTKSKSGVDASSPEVLSSLEGIANVEFKFNTDANLPSKKYYETPLHGESIRIPLHSPTHYENRTILQELKSSSQDSQETVIDTTKRVDAVVEDIPGDTESNIPVQNSKTDSSKRQSSTSSENIVFSTNLGNNNNDIFTTKLPKEKHVKDVVTDTKTDTNQPEIAEKVVEPVSEKPPPAVDKQVTPDEIPKSASRETIKERKKISRSASLNSSKEADEVGRIEEPPKGVSAETKNNKNSIMLGSIPNEDRYSSESERDSELDYLKAKKEAEEKPESVEPERKGLVYQQDSFEDELPYVPTTLPLERSVAVPIVPVKQRGTFEMRTYPIERPRSTTPINLSTLEDYCEDVVGAVNTENITKAIEKLKICLPRDESTDRTTKAKSPRRPATSANWFTFAEKSSQKRSSPTQESEAGPPPLPPKGVQKEWINFEEIPERRKPPRRIQTIPSRGNIEVSESVLQENVVYSYVNPEDCKCECHEIAREREQQARQQEETTRVQEDEVPLLEEDPGDEDKSTQEFVDRIKVDISMSDRRSVISDSSIDLSTSLEHPETTNNLDPSLRTPFTGDLGISSNRSSIVSQDEPQSPDISTPNAFPKTS
ncbi:hypothetical protein ILUMI_06542 [Ignelater luminosus]|uniref:Uncharacterized protein n=1 Tax=Ignelater luminosus TaxID=2038154 RepID=A0A8K0D572_IGNLU|nr:hypothetical protein ILUMI_06542 [Ignelater luminosus]